MKNERGFTLIELLIVVAIIGIIAAIAVPGLLSARRAGNEAAAVGSLKAINGAQAIYAASCGSGYYSPSLSNLGTPPAGGSPFISPDLSTGDTVVKSAYSVTMGSSSGVAAQAPASCNGLAAGAVVVGYNATATPTPGGGTRAFGTNTTGTVFTAVQQSALAMTDNTAPAGAVPIQ